MKHITKTLVAAIGLPLCLQQAVAIPTDTPIYQDIDAIGVLLSGPAGGGALSYTDVFDIRAGANDGSPSVTIAGNPNGLNAYLNAGETFNDILGFVPEGALRVTSAFAYFYLRGANGANDVYSFDLTGFLLDSAEGRGTFARTILGGDLGELGLNFLNNNGYLEYTVERDGGAFTLDYAQLQVLSVGPGGSDPSGVPDAGSTAGLLGCALFALGTVARRLKVQ